MTITLPLSAPTAPSRPVTERPTTELITMLAAAGLAGRGGAGFPIARKLQAALGTRPRLVVNACEGEQLSIKDSWILTEDPKPMLTGLQALAATLTASSIVLAVHEGTAAHRAAQSWPTRNWLEVLTVPSGYVSSEASAVVSALDGGRAVPFSHRRPLAEGARRKPATVVQNAETVYWVGKIISHGVDWFRSYGTAHDPGPRLASVSGAVARSGVVQASATFSVGDLIGAAGGLSEPAQSVLLGGYGGTWVGLDAVAGVAWSDHTLARLGAQTGAGVVHVLSDRECPLQVVGAQLDYLAAQSARQCGPCMFGLPAVAADWREMITGGPSSVPAEHRLRGRLGLLPGRGGCHHPDGAARNAASALNTFADHLRAHRAGGCPHEVRR